MAGVSSWWATPARPDRHFSSSELRASEQHHRRLRRAGAASFGAKALLLVGTLVLAGAIGDRPSLDGPFDRQWGTRTGLLEALLSPRVLVGSAMVVISFWLPSVVADAWFEYRFGHGRPDHQPVPIGWFGFTTCLVAGGSFVVAVVVTGGLYQLLGARSDWPLILIGVAVVALVVVGVGERRLRGLSPDQEEAVDPQSELGRELAEVADRFGLADLRFGTTDRTPGAGGGEAGPNAFSMGIGRNRRVVLTEALLAEGRPTRDFVVAHELTHLRRHHVAVQSLAQLVLPAAAVAAFAALVGWDRPWDLLNLDPFDPLGAAVVPLVIGATSGVVGIVPSWLSRAHERSADAGAVEAMGPLSDSLARRLYLVPGVDLSPPWWTRLHAAHPAPAERLEFLSRAERLRPFRADR